MKRLLIVSILVTLSTGCVGGLQSDQPKEGSGEINETTERTINESSIESADFDEWMDSNFMKDAPHSEAEMITMSETVIVHPFNPFESRQIYIFVEQSDVIREKTAYVEESMQYWEENAWEYIGYPVDLFLTDEKPEAHVIVEFEAGPIRCGHHVGDILGCAPLNSHSTVEIPSTIQILIGQNSPSTFRTITHELGHVFGLDHDDEPFEIMSDNNSIQDRYDPISVYIDGTRSSQIDQITHALDYYERGAHDTLENPPNFTVVDDPRKAVFVVEFNQSHDCGDGIAACRRVSEYNGQHTIVISHGRSQYSGWYFAYMLQFYFFEDPEDFPDVLAHDTSARTAGSSWWR